MDPATSLPWLLGTAWLLPLVSFGLIVFFGPKMGRAGRLAGYVATGAIVGACLLSLVALLAVWIPHRAAGQARMDGARTHAAAATAGTTGGHLGANHEERVARPEMLESWGLMARPSPFDPSHPEPVFSAPRAARQRHGLNRTELQSAGYTLTAGHGAAVEAGEHGSEHGGEHEQAVPVYFAGDWYSLGEFGALEITIGYYIDALTVAMFVMVTFVASCIHFYSMGYMHEELADVTDHEVTVGGGEPLCRRGRYHRFFQYLSLFSFSMLGVIIAGNMAMVFVFWELVGICSYFLIGFYFERKSASDAANKAFIVNRIGDFGMIIGLMALWAGLGTFTFGDRQDAHGQTVRTEDGTVAKPGIFSQLRAPENQFRLAAPDKVVRQALATKRDQIARYLVPDRPSLPPAPAAGVAAEAVREEQAKQAEAIERWLGRLGRWRAERQAWAAAQGEWLAANEAWIAATRKSLDIPEVPEDIAAWSAVDKEKWIRNRLLPVNRIALAQAIGARLDDELDLWRSGTAPGDPNPYGYWLLVLAGLGIFCGCVGKSAQFPLHVWLPDAMEGPTPVSALVHSATMVAAGVYLAGRFYPAFAPEVLLVIAYIGGFTLLLAATIALTATDIKRVLAYSTISQLGYMMLAVGVGGWLAAMFHLITHALFKSLLFLCSGSVIHGVHTQEMPLMGGLRKKMPWTAYTMLAGCLAIIGAGIPLVVGLSGYYSKDAILEQSLSFANANPRHAVLFYTAAGGAALTAFYMFRLWYMTFAGVPRDEERYRHAHESPKVMVYPLVVLAFCAVIAGWPALGLTRLLEQARPAGTLATVDGGLLLPALVVPDEHLGHADAIKVPATLIASATALAGLLLATVFYAWRLLDPNEVRGQFRAVHRFLLGKWWFDELYDVIAVRPVHFIAGVAARIDLRIIDGIIHALAALARSVARLQDALVDRMLVDGFVNLVARRTWAAGLSLRAVQTGRLRQYVMFLALGTVVLFLLITFVRSYAAAGM